MNEQNASRLVTFTYEGREYSCLSSFKLYSEIEDMVTFSRISMIFANGMSRSVDMPYSHVAHVCYCVMKHAGIPVRNQLEVMDLVIKHKLPWMEILMQLIKNYYNVLPQSVSEDEIEKKLPSKPKAKRKSSSR